jgi:hypothetical protein
MGAGDFIYSPAGATIPSPLGLVPNAAPGTPASGINFTSQLFANDALPVWVDQSAQTWIAQQSLWNNAVIILSPRDGTSTLNCIGGTSILTIDTSVVSTSTPVVTSKYTRAAKTIHTSVAAVNRGAGFTWNALNTSRMWHRGSAVGQGGFFAFFRFGMEAYAAGNRLFVGMDASGTLANWYTGDPSAQTSSYVGLGMDAADATPTLYTRNNVTTTKTAIAGMPAAATAGAFYVDFYLYSPPNGSVIYYRVDDLVAGTTVVDTSIATTLPVNTTYMLPIIVMGSGTSAASCAVSIAKVYCIGQQN